MTQEAKAKRVREALDIVLNAPDDVLNDALTDGYFDGIEGEVARCLVAKP